ncbi:bouquet formation protein Bqt2 [Schizosaccharomyces octosporus yFS286]|uniref:Bouquet formation protein Bqt2 n=1 Tax=Schizosaccharomyces octosporus (strain yFS286) TaxID=483514 RepID=S9QY97_SCHOY|nr:bouquet formation protein Bqt2 [Schizosaccharomyces octosporus yFS286]EPX71280.1 bouquet formation protein Bqt2 [Schizosaccharomyces octosporus yFS286]
MFRGKCAYFDETVPSHLIALWQIHNGTAKFLPEGYHKFDYAFSMNAGKKVRLSIYETLCTTSPWWIAEQVTILRRGKPKMAPIIHFNEVEPLYVDHRIQTVYLQPIRSPNL